MEKQRNIVIEILRIVAMLMIVCGHAFLYGVESYGDKIGCFLFKVLDYICNPGVNIFVIISGYFMINSKFSVKRLLLIWLQVFFYSVSLYLVMVISGSIDFSVIQFIKVLLPISFDRYWFIRVYLYMYMCSPFLNLLLMRLSKKNFLMLFALGWILMVIPASIPAITTFNAAGGEWYTLVFYVVLHRCISL